MKKNIHPEYYQDAKVTCACGNIFVVGSTLPEIRVEICSHCHPFYTGKQKLLDTARRVEKFQERLAKKTQVAAIRKGKQVKKIKAQIRKTKIKKISEE
ncbi:MAG: 50S ribosomal protein L31 [Candidatus Buchananbacteria bacterium RIFCSPHIGHO2_01_FULL_39_14]|uniref:Large ribosomal subunit protein bL31 n=2 Tax=Candidatus Buchananiibacteriota TaxID=1817903 RepID=A0A1G1YPJ4_9BACT|nr:MAG: 50S ribosomal protein L31 [Candidatus Buchananbacteria bacterium RIFCSPHIGHO2_01_FULL_39_14]OGY49648.1 MAG: 50S ribosomal protein L31 [Candidatus Buchananbacteria bacterium RIFCSPHIGHO2_02_FULL_39_17]OGY54278.1 MAG: 50S ribosomal protein L31 [Candidatus Buchananbacteria bacterium RIFCSPLOWO2_01_FULL_40_23b]